LPADPPTVDKALLLLLFPVFALLTTICEPKELDAERFSEAMIAV